MVIIREARKQRFTILPNDMLERTDMTWEAKGMLSYILMLPDNYPLTQKKLHESFPGGRDRTRRIFHELIRLGYAKRIPMPAEKEGQWSGQAYKVSETPMPHGERARSY